MSKIAEVEESDLRLTKEVAQLLRVPESTLRYWRAIGLGPRSFKLGRRVVYRAADVQSWLNDQAERSTGHAA